MNHRENRGKKKKEGGGLKEKREGKRDGNRRIEGVIGPTGKCKEREEKGRGREKTVSQPQARREVFEKGMKGKKGKKRGLSQYGNLKILPGPGVGGGERKTSGKKRGGERKARMERLYIS